MTDSITPEVVEDDIQPLSREDLTVRYVLEGMDLCHAAVKAGYGKSYARSKIYLNQSLQGKIQDALDRLVKYSKHKVQQATPRMAETVTKAVELYENKPELFIEKPKALETAMKIAGLQGPDVLHQETNIVQYNTAQNVVGMAWKKEE